MTQKRYTSLFCTSSVLLSYQKLFFNSNCGGKAPFNGIGRKIPKTAKLRVGFGIFLRFFRISHEMLILLIFYQLLFHYPSVRCFNHHQRSNFTFDSDFYAYKRNSSNRTSFAPYSSSLLDIYLRIRC